MAQVPKSSGVAKKKSIHKAKQVRLWVRAKFSGFRRSKVQQNVHQTIVQVEGVSDRKAASYYFGKRVAFVYKTKSGDKDKRIKVRIYLPQTIWGRINKAHGNNGAVLARFAHNLPPRAIGSTLRVMLFPQRG